jgi:hypothetical protein
MASPMPRLPPDMTMVRSFSEALTDSPELVSVLRRTLEYR